MTVTTYKISELFDALKDSPATIDAYIQHHNTELGIKDRPAMVIFPGGGYGFTSNREAEPIALEFAQRGYQCFVVWYTCAPAQYPQQLLEAAAAVSFARSNAEKFNLNPSKISVIGFSAGGHLASSIGTLYGDKVVTEALGIDERQARPDAMVLSYPVISLDEYTHWGSRENVIGKNENVDELVNKLSNQRNVTPDTPPAFIWHTTDDNAVPSENSLMMAMQLKKNNVPFELHMYAAGMHGLSLATEQVFGREDNWWCTDKRIAHWPNDCDGFLRELYKRQGKSER